MRMRPKCSGFSASAFLVSEAEGTFTYSFLTNRKYRARNINPTAMEM